MEASRQHARHFAHIGPRFGHIGEGDNRHGGDSQFPDLVAFIVTGLKKHTRARTHLSWHVIVNHVWATTILTWKKFCAQDNV